MTITTNGTITGISDINSGSAVSLNIPLTSGSSSNLSLFGLGARVSTNGYYTAGDGGSAIYEKVSVATHALSFTSADGGIWQLADDQPVTALNAGCKRNEDTLCDTQVANAFAALTARGGGTFYLPTGYIYIQKFTVPAKVNIVGMGSKVSTIKARFNTPGTGDYGIMEMTDGVVEGCLYQGFTIQWNGGTSVWGIYLSSNLGAGTSGMWRCRFKDVVLMQFHNGMWLRGGATGSTNPHQWIDLEEMEIRNNQGTVAGHNLRFTGQVNQVTSNNVLLDTSSGTRDGTALVFDRDPLASATGRVPWGHVHKLTSIQSRSIGVSMRGGQNITLDTPYFENLPYGISVDGVSDSVGADLAVVRPRFADIGTSATYSIADGYWITAVNQATVRVHDPLNLSGAPTTQRYQATAPAYISVENGRSIGTLTSSVDFGVLPSLSATGSTTAGIVLINYSGAALVNIGTATEIATLYDNKFVGEKVIIKASGDLVFNQTGNIRLENNKTIIPSGFYAEAIKLDSATWAVRALDADKPFIVMSGVASGIAPTGTVGANGALTLGTALPNIYSVGLYLYFPAGAVYSGSAAGSYWCVMSSTTVGTVYNNVLVDVPSVPSSPTAIVDAGPGAFTGVTSEVTLASYTIKGGTLGTNGQVRSDETWLANNTAGAKTIRGKFGGTQGMSGSLASNLSLHLMTIFRNRGSESSNGTFAALSMGATSGSAGGFLSINTANDWIWSKTAQTATATDYMIIDGFLLEIFTK